MHGFLPIHFSWHICSPKFCCLLIEAYPDSIHHEVKGVPVLNHVLISPGVDDSVPLAVLNLLLDKCPDPEDACRLRINDWPLLHKVAGHNISRATEICRLLIRAFPELVLEHARINRVKHLLHRSCPSASMPFSEWNKLLQISSLPRVETQ